MAAGWEGSANQLRSKCSIPVCAPALPPLPTLPPTHPSLYPPTHPPTHQLTHPSPCSIKNWTRDPVTCSTCPVFEDKPHRPERPHRDDKPDGRHEEWRH